MTSHILRHTYATNLIAGGMDIKTAQRLMGHKKATILLDIYAHVKDDRPEDMYAKVVKIIGKKR